jgi:hypothetical protein
MSGGPVGECIVGGMGRGACILEQLDPFEAHDIEDCAEALDQIEAVPEEPELVEDTEIRGR